jgi:glycyl-tRNA synthetase beta chain
LRIIEHEPTLRIDELVECSVELYQRDGFAAEDTARSAKKQIIEFFKNRCELFLKDRGLAYDVVAAVASVSWMRPAVAVERAQAITRLRGDEPFERLITGVKRVGNILSRERRVFGADWDQLQAAFGPSTMLTEDIMYEVSMFVEDAEIKLFEVVADATTKLIELEKRDGFSRILKALSSLADPIDEYFDRVLVNCDRADVRENRHNFLASVYAVFSRYADFLCIVEEGPSQQPS